MTTNHEVPGRSDLGEEILEALSAPDADRLLNPPHKPTSPEPEPPLPSPTPPPSSPEAEYRQAIVRGWADQARNLRRFGIPAFMLDGENILTYTSDGGEQRSAVTSNYEMRFAMTRQMKALAIATGGLLLVRGPKECRDVYGVERFPKTLIYRRPNEEEVTRLFHVTMPTLERREARWREWNFIVGYPFLILDGADLEIPRGLDHLPQAPTFVKDILLSPQFGERYV